MRPRCGLRPKSPQQAAGIRIEPAPSDAVDAGTSPAATAAAGPPLEPPGVRCGFQGLRVIPPAAVSVNGQIASSGVRVTPMTMAPARPQAAHELGVMRLRRVAGVGAAHSRRARYVRVVP